MAQESTGRLLSSIRFELPFGCGRLNWNAIVSIAEKENETSTTLRQPYRWPYIVGAMLLLWLLLGVMWTFWSVQKTREQHELRERIDAYENPTTKTN